MKKAANTKPKRDHTKFLKKKLNAKQRRENVAKKMKIATQQAAKKAKKWESTNKYNMFHYKNSSHH